MAQVRTSLTAVMTAFRSALIATGLYTEVNCYISEDTDPSPVVGGPQAVITLDSADDGQSGKAGGGRYTTPVTVSLAVHVVDRHASDQTGRDSFRLLDPSRGLIGTAEAIINKMDLTFLDDGSGNTITILPIQFLGLPMPRRYGRAWEWAGVRLRWQATFLREYTDPTL